MTDGNPRAFENLSHSGLFKIASKDDRNVTLTLDTYMGNTGFAVWTGAGGKPWKINLPRLTIKRMTTLLKTIRANPSIRTEAILLNRWEEGDNKKGSYKQYGRIAFGIDETNLVFIEIAANDLSGKHVFVFKPDGRFDFSSTSLSEKDHIVAVLSYLIDTLDYTSGMSERLSSFPRPPMGGGQNKGGGNYNKGGGNYNRNQEQKSTTFSGGADIENDLYV